MTLPSLLCIHGAANAAWVWQFWRQELAKLGWEVNVLDLRGHGQSLPIDLSTATMEDYLWDVESVFEQIAVARGRPPVLAGWSMGGLLAMMQAARNESVPALLLFEPSAPEQVAGRADPDTVRSTPAIAFGPEFYGVYPDDLPRSREVMPDLSEEERALVIAGSTGALESGFARRQRLRGISIPAGSIKSPALVVHGPEAAVSMPERSTRLALYLAAETLTVQGASHWGLVMSRRAVQAAAPEVDDWLRRNLSETP